MTEPADFGEQIAGESGLGRRIAKSRLTADWRDTVAGVGLGLLAVGLLFVWWPLALIVTGALLLLGAALAAKHEPVP